MKNKKVICEHCCKGSKFQIYVSENIYVTLLTVCKTQKSWLAMTLLMSADVRWKKIRQLSTSVPFSFY